jgi:hypothetical protein
VLNQGRADFAARCFFSRYKHILVPDSYATGGSEAIREHFAKTLAADGFCSVDDIKSCAHGT